MAGAWALVVRPTAVVAARPPLLAPPAFQHGAAVMVAMVLAPELEMVPAMLHPPARTLFPTTRPRSPGVGFLPSGPAHKRPLLVTSHPTRDLTPQLLRHLRMLVIRRFVCVSCCYCSSGCCCGHGGGVSVSGFTHI